VTELLFASALLQWLVIVDLLVAVLALGRQVGILHTRLAPAGALMTGTGPKVGDMAPTLVLEDLRGNAFALGGPRDCAQLLLFVSPTCPICKALLPAARSLARDERRQLTLAFASDGGARAEHERYVADMHIDDCPYVLSRELGMQFQVGKLPYAVLIDREGVLRAKGLVNSREHLESLVEAMDTGYASIQDYLANSGSARPP
jgi:methylamine dehydrogenase accessory protein MauD